MKLFDLFLISRWESFFARNCLLLFKVFNMFTRTNIAEVLVVPFYLHSSGEFNGGFRAFAVYVFFQLQIDLYLRAR
jgi:hypothetical protein